jgi:hypothetical protein
VLVGDIERMNRFTLRYAPLIRTLIAAFVVFTFNWCDHLGDEDCGFGAVSAGCTIFSQAAHPAASTSCDDAGPHCSCICHIAFWRVAASPLAALVPFEPAPTATIVSPSGLFASDIFHPPISA